MNTIESEAHRLIEAGKSCIPVDMSKDAEGKAKKSALVPWTGLQKRLPTHDEWVTWGKRFPNAGLALITGRVSNRTVVDLDSNEAIDLVADYLPEQMEIPTVLTPRPGRHLHFQYTEGVPTSKNSIQHIDTRNDGGYVIVPPTPGYEYAFGSGIEEEDVPVMPSALMQYIKDIFFILCTGDSQHKGNAESQRSQMSRKITLDFRQGGRNDSLFSVAYSALRGGIGEANALQLLVELNQLCKPPLPEKEVERIFKSALKRSQRRERNVRADVREFVAVTSGDFSCDELYRSVMFVTQEEKAAARQALVTLCREGVIERVGTRNGWYRRVDNAVEYMDFLNASTKEHPVVLPLGLGDYMKLYPGNIIIVAGAKGGAKTSFLLNLTKLNQGTHEVVYMNSEMGAEELRIRLEGFKDVPLSAWTRKFISRSHDWHDIVKPSENTIWVIDYMEPPEDQPFLVGRFIKQIHEKMGGKGLCFIGIQKPEGRKYGLGGRFTTDKARAYLALDYDRERKLHRIEIVDAKAWKGPRNPRGLVRYYQVMDQGARYANLGCWQDLRP